MFLYTMIVLYNEANDNLFPDGKYNDGKQLLIKLCKVIRLENLFQNLN